MAAATVPQGDGAAEVRHRAAELVALLLGEADADDG
jgi:hypothetical protein